MKMDVKWVGEWWFLPGMIRSFPPGALPWRQFQGSLWSKEARFGLRFPGSAEWDPQVAGNSVSVLSNVLLNRLFFKNNDYNRFKKRGRIGFPAGRDSRRYISLMERNDRCCMQSVKGFLRPGFQALFIGQFVFKRVILAITRPIAGQEHKYPLKKQACPGAPLLSS